MTCSITSYAKADENNPNRITSVVLDIDGNKLKIEIPDDGSIVTQTQLINYCKTEAQNYFDKNYYIIDVDSILNTSLF